MADRWTDERDRDWRDQDWDRSERYGRGRERDDYGRPERGGEERSFDPRGGYDFEPRGGYDDDYRYRADRDYDADLGYGESGFGRPRYGGPSEGPWRGGEERDVGGARFRGPGRDRVFGERETGASYRPRGGPQGQAERDRGWGEEPRYGSGRDIDQGRFAGRGGGRDYVEGGRYLGDDARRPIYREEYGYGGVEYGDVPRGYETRSRAGGREGREDYGQRWSGRERRGEYEADYDRSEHYTPNVREGREEHQRGWWDRTRDEVASWFGDHDAERRREWDEMQAGHRGRGPKGYRRSDERIDEEVHDRLTDDPWLDASAIQVEVKDGEVTLSGTVPERDAKHRAEHLIEDISGVDHVQNNLRVERREPLTRASRGWGDNMMAAQDTGGVFAATGAHQTTPTGTAGGQTVDEERSETIRRGE